MSKILLKQFSSGLGGGGRSWMYARIFGESIYENQPVGSQEIDGVVNMHSTLRLLWKHPWMVGWLWWLALVLCTGCTFMTEFHDA